LTIILWLLAINHWLHLPTKKSEMIEGILRQTKKTSQQHTAQLLKLEFKQMVAFAHKKIRDD